jgi:hypothetical protein
MLLGAGLVLLGGAAMPGQGSSAARQSPINREPLMIHAIGTFDIKITPQKPDNPEAEHSSVGRMSIDKQFHGGLEGISKGEMLATMSSVQGSAGYVAMEQVTGVLDGKHGSFVLQHFGVMDKGKASLNVSVVPDSGTGELVGLSGTMTIDVSGGKHSYNFEYTIKP